MDEREDIYADDEERLIERVRKCPVCNAVSFPWCYGEFEICPTCGWVDDEYQEENPDEGDLYNIMSLNKAKAAYAKGKKVK